MRTDSSRKHLLSIENLPEEEFCTLLNNAQALIELSERDIKKAPTLRGKTVINLFYEPSTRTSTSFEIATKRLSGEAINVAAAKSSMKKGESLLDTARTLQAMKPEVLVVRHASAGVPVFLSRFLKDTSVINAGDGMHEHPTQALLDCLSLMQHYGQGVDGLKGKRVAIVGDISHSRVARSMIFAQHMLGNEINLVGPPTVAHKTLAEGFPGKLSVYYDLREGLKGCDIIIVLRLQLERQTNHFIPTMQEYTNEFFVTKEILDEVANPGYVVMHPGPVNRGVEVQSDLIDSERSLMNDMVTCGIATRMACLVYLCFGSNVGVEDAIN